MKKFYLILIFVLAAVLAACQDGAEVDVDATVAAAVSATQSANVAPATATVVPATATPVPPTATAEPTATATEPPPTLTLTPIPSATPTATPVPPLVVTEGDNGTTYWFTEDGFEITIAGEWASVNLDPELFDEALAEMGDQNEELSGLLSSDLFRNLVANGIRFYAINTSTESVASGNPANINVLVQPLQVPFTTEAYAELNVSQLTQYFDLATEIDQSAVQLGDDVGVRLDYVSNLTNPLGQDLQLSTTQYLLVKDDISYIISITMPIELVDSFKAEAEEIGQSFRLVGD